MRHSQEARAITMLSKEWLQIKKINKTLLQDHQPLEMLLVTKHHEMTKTPNLK